MNLKYLYYNNNTYKYTGNRYPAVVEFAMNQEIPMNLLPQNDPLCSTIEFDEYYLNFLDSLNAQNKQKAKTVYDLHLNTESNKHTTTPLLKYIAERKCDRTGDGKDERIQKTYRKKIRDNCIVFVNSSVKKTRYKYQTKFNKKKQLYTEVY